MKYLIIHFRYTSVHSEHTSTEILIDGADKVSWICVDMASDEDGSNGGTQRWSHVS